MHIKEIHIRGFKRFTQLDIVEIPAATKLVVLAGPNGNGKSSLFDSFLHFHHTRMSGLGHNWYPDYHEKTSAEPIGIGRDDRTKILFHETVDKKNSKKAFYVRSAYRNEPDFETRELQRTSSDLDRRRLDRLIDNDASVSINYRRIASFAVDELYTGNESKTYGQFRKETSGEINKYLHRLFPNLTLTDLGRPLDRGTFFFTKGVSKNFPYKNLSGGEKAVFDILLDIVVNRKDFDDTVYAVDEPESHINPRIHAELLRVLHDIIPDGCQLWIATHAIGMLRAARDIAVQQPGHVIFLDFEKDFDAPQTLRPEAFDRVFWERSLAVAFADMAALIAPRVIIRCEGEHRKHGNGFDSQVYEKIFAAEFPDVRFVSSGSANDVKKDISLVAAAMEGKIPGLTFERLLDRDNMSDAERADEISKGARVLSRRHLESYLFDDEILRSLAHECGHPQLAGQLIQERDTALAAAAARGNPSDDMKSASGQAFVKIRAVLDLKKAGNTAEVFMRDTLAPLVKPDTNVYQELRADIFL